QLLACSCSRTCSSFIPVRCRANQIAIARALLPRLVRSSAHGRPHSFSIAATISAQLTPPNVLRPPAQWLSLETVRQWADLSAACRRELDERITHDQLPRHRQSLH